MTTIEIEILLHYAYRAEDYRDGDFSSPAVRSAIDSFCRLGILLVETDSDRQYALSEGGELYIEALKKVPLPTKVWTMPAPY